MTVSEHFASNSRERLPLGDAAGRARSAFRLGDLQANANQPRVAQHDGGDVRTLAMWDFYFIEEACRRLPRSQGIFHLHNGWPGLDTARFAAGGGHRAVQFNAHRARLDPGAVQDWAEAEVVKTDPGWTIVSTRLIQELPDPARFVECALRTRRAGSGVVMTGMGGLSPYVYNAELRLGLITPELISRWSDKPPLLSATERDEPESGWPHHLVFGVAYD